MVIRQSYHRPVVADEVIELYDVRRVEFFGERHPIVLDNGDDGFLVSICNVLLLRGTVTIDRLNALTKSELLSLVQELLIMSIPDSQEVDEALNILQSLTSKHDLICPCSTGIKDFLPIVELKLFRVLDINLYHGWLLNPQDCTISSEVCLPKQLASVNNMELDGLKSKRRGDLEEEESLLKALQLSQEETYQHIGTEAMSGENQVPKADVKEEQEREVYKEKEKELEVYKEEDQKPEAYEEEDQEPEAYEEEDQEPETYEEEDQEPEVFEEEEQKPVVYLKEDQGPEEALLYEGKSQLTPNYLKSCSQLTEKGLLSLMDDVDGVKENELCIFLRNNHFSTLYKYNGELYLLENGDISFPDIVWRKLYEIEDINPIFTAGDLLGVESACSSSPEEHNYGW